MIELIRGDAATIPVTNLVDASGNAAVFSDTDELVWTAKRDHATPVGEAFFVLSSVTFDIAINVGENSASIAVSTDDWATFGPLTEDVEFVWDIEYHPLGDATQAVTLAWGTGVIRADVTGNQIFYDSSVAPSPDAYVSLPVFRAAIRDTSQFDSESMELAIDAASRTIEAACGRKFYQRTSTEYFVPNDPWILEFDDMDLATTEDLTVFVQWADRENYVEQRVLGVDFFAEPTGRSSQGIESWPFTQLRALNGKMWPYRYVGYQRPTIQVNGTWGWPAIPSPIVQATIIVAAYLYKRPEAALGTTGMAEFGLLRVKDPDVGKLIQPYKKGSTLFLA